MTDLQEFESATSTESLLPVELTIHDHYGRETRVVLHKLPAIFGRDDLADVSLIDPWTSHSHCEIDQIGDVLVVRDLDSKNGIFMHGHRVLEAGVLSGDRLTIGQTEIVVHYPGRTHAEIETEGNEPLKQSPSKAYGPETAELLY